MHKLTSFSLLFCALLGLLCATGCIQKTPNTVVVYAALDREFSEPILNDLEKELGIDIAEKFDQESNKGVGFTNEIIQNGSNPRCDLFWNNEIMHTMRLQKLGLLEVYESPNARNFPEDFISTKKQWHGFAARARVLIINTDLIPDENDRPDSIYDLADPKWKDKCAMARPLFGTTSTHAAVLFSELGEAKAKKLLIDISNNAAIEGGNKQVALKVARGQFAFGITDTDDAVIELEQGQPVAIVFPDQAEGQLGTLVIPNTLAIIKNGPNSEKAKKLVDRLLQADIEERLAKGSSAQIPLNRLVETKSRVEPKSSELKIMKVDFGAAASGWDKNAKTLTEIFPLGK